MKRKLIYCPDFNPSSFVLLFERGSNGESWSVRDFSDPGIVSIRYAHHFACSLVEIYARAVHVEEAPVRSTSDAAYWHRKTMELNAEHLGAGNQRFEDEPIGAVQSRPSGFPVYKIDSLMSRLKSRKAHDRKRIFESPNSEDWVTWNMFALAQEFAANSWWPHLVELARRDCPTLDLPTGWTQKPTLSYWQHIPSPQDYESASRRRMRVSDVPAIADRSSKRNPVEGTSEIDLAMRNDVLTVFLEAKLGSDVSGSTTNDPSRNQIARNIDCLIDAAEGGTPFFWMLVRDRGAGRRCVQLIKAYRERPSTLEADLPHRNRATLAEVARRLAIIVWTDLAKLLPEPTSASPLELSIYRELLRRIR